MVCAVRFCNGGNRLYARKERGQYHHEKPDGLLPWHNCLFLLEAGLSMGENALFGLICKPNMQMFTNFYRYD